MIIHQAAFAEKGPFLKGNLHGHTTRSDGQNTPEEVLRFLRERGYDFAALTDHRIYNFKNFAPETGITVIPGMEYDNMLEQGNGFRCFDTVCIGPEKENGNGYEQDQTFPSGTAPNQEEYQAQLDQIHAKGNLTFYCHPEWSSTPARYFEKQKGNFAMEIWNTCSVRINDSEMNAAYWDEVLGQGVRIFGVAVDDGHSLADYAGGWVMVRAENTVPAILDALKEGRFYSSCGPVITDFYIEDDNAVVECEPAAKICLHADRHPGRVVASDDGALTRAVFPLSTWAGNYDDYVRATVLDAKGNRAWTNPIWLKP